MSLKQNDDIIVCSKLLSNAVEENFTEDNSDEDGLSTPKERHSSVEEEGVSGGTIRRLGDESANSPLETNATTTSSTKINNDECPAELKTLRYKIMLMNGNTPVEMAPPAKNSYDNLQQFLEKERNNNTKENWSKLNRTVKHKKIVEFVDNYTVSNSLSEKEHDRLLEMLKQNMIKGKLAKNKEVTYDKTKGVIKDMPCLVFNKATRHFTIKNLDAQKHSTTIKKAPMSFVREATPPATTTEPISEV